MTVHATPPHGATTTPCCDTYPGELPDGDDLTLRPFAVTCSVRAMMGVMEIEGHIFPAVVEHAEGTRCTRCGVIFQARSVATCSEGIAYVAEHGFPAEPRQP